VFFKESLRSKDFVVMAELPLTPGSCRESLLADAGLLRDCVDGYLLTDNQYGQPHMSPLAAASILRNDGFDPVLQISCRNRNRIALIGELLGARAIGVESLMLIRGGVLPEGYKPRPRAVMDTDAKDLIATLNMISDDEVFEGPIDFLIAAAATVHHPAPDWHPEEISAKAAAGAQLFITQVCHDIDVLRRYMAHIKKKKMLRRVSVIVSVALIQSNSADRGHTWHRRNQFCGDWRVTADSRNSRDVRHWAHSLLNCQAEKSSGEQFSKLPEIRIT